MPAESATALDLPRGMMAKECTTGGRVGQIIAVRDPWYRAERQDPALASQLKRSLPGNIGEEVVNLPIPLR